jgi:hypothetical protein
MLALAFSRVDARIGFFGGSLAMDYRPSGWRNPLSKRRILIPLVLRWTEHSCLLSLR